MAVCPPDGLQEREWKVCQRDVGRSHSLGYFFQGLSFSVVLLETATVNSSDHFLRKAR